MRAGLGVALVCFVSSLVYCAEPIEDETPQAEAIKANFARLVSEDKAVKREALLYFGKVDKTFAAEVPIFTASLTDERSQVRAISAYALGKIGQAAAGAIPEVEKLLADSSATVQKYAKRALERLKPFKPVPKKVTPEEAALLLAENLRSSGNKDEVVETAKRIVVWDTKELFESPEVHATEERPAKGMKSFFYEGMDYKGKPTWVFTYYATPRGRPPKGGWPAMVCAHGGGGSAFPAWVAHWNKKGYAAIAMDLEGHLPGGGHFGVEGGHPVSQPHKNAGPSRDGWFGDIGLPDKEQWFYHAVADVIRANSLLRSYPEINKEKIGLTGISWGGTIVSAVAGIDSRFAFVIPVYGGGYIHQHKMTAKQFREYNTKWDPPEHLPYAKMPMLWVVGFNEPVFPLDLFCKSAGKAAGPSILCIRPFLIHGHGFGWDEVWEIGGFANGVVNGGKPIPTLGKPKVDPKDGLVHAKFTGELKSAVLGYTTADKWKTGALRTLPCTIGKGEVIASKPLPKGAKAFMINARGGGVWTDGCVGSVLVPVRH